MPTITVDMSRLLWDGMQRALEFATKSKLKFRSTEDQAYGSFPQALDELLSTADVALELKMHD